MNSRRMCAGAINNRPDQYQIQEVFLQVANVTLR
jgi:hypothetical protein